MAMLNMSEISPQNSQAGPGCCPVHSTSAGPRLALMIFGAGLIVRVTVLMGLECQGKICSSCDYTNVILQHKWC